MESAVSRMFVPVKKGLFPIKCLVKGFALGAVCLAPGISAGTMALVMGIYDKIVFSVTSLFPVSEKTKNSLIFLCLLTSGVVLSFVVLSKGMSQLLLLFPLQMYSFFTGLIVASLPRLLSQTDFNLRALWGRFKPQSPLLPQESIKSKSLKSLLLILAVALGFFAFLNLKGSEFGKEFSQRPFTVNTPESSHLSKGFNKESYPRPFAEDSKESSHLSAPPVTGFFWLFFVSGFLGFFASVLPGLSGSTVLLLLGSYSKTLKALTDWDLKPLMVFVAGGLLGLFCAFYFVRFFLQKNRKLFFCIILGLILGSLPEIIPWEQGFENKTFTALKVFVFLFFGMALLWFTEKRFFLNKV